LQKRLGSAARANFSADGICWLLLMTPSRSQRGPVMGAAAHDHCFVLIGME
jgi:hypothetical protein